MITDSSEKISTQFAGAKRQILASWIGTLGLVGITYGLGASTAALNIGIILLLIASVLVLDDIIKTITIDKALLAAMLTAFLLFATLWAIYQFQVDAKSAWKEFRSLVKIAGLPALAAGWWLQRGHLRYHHLLALLTLGILIGCFEGINFERALHSPFAGRNILTYIKMNPNELGFLAGILFIVSSISLFLGARAKSSLPGSDRLWNSLYILTAGVSGYLVITSQSRAIILGICIALVSILIFRIVIARQGAKQQGRKYLAITILVLAFLSLVLISPMGKVLVERFDGVGKSLSILISNDMEQLSDISDSLSHRIMMWQEGVSLIAESPLIGHGPGTARSLLAESSHTELHFSHFHNFWIHLLVVVGILGALGFAALFLSYTIESVKGVVSHDNYIGWLSLALWVYFFVAIVAQLRINHPSGEAFVILAGGMSYYCAFSTLQKASRAS